MNPDVFPWQQQNWELLSRYILEKRPPQALLISGSQGLGKLKLAHQFAQTLLCTSSSQTGFYCGQCHSCHLFHSQTHPDFIELSPEEEGKIIGINPIRALITKLSLKPQFETYRVVLIHPADKMNNAAANAFLKCLEEPNERTCIIMLAENLSLLPATVKSRCQKLLIHQPSTDTATQWLQQQHIQENLPQLLSLAQGAPLLAQHYAKEGLLSQYLHCFNDWLIVSKTSTSLLEIAERWHKQNATHLILWLTSWVSDVIKCTFDRETQLASTPELRKSLQELALKLNLKSLYQFYDVLLSSQQRIHSQINKQLLFENILIQWSTLNKKASNHAQP